MTVSAQWRRTANADRTNDRRRENPISVTTIDRRTISRGLVDDRTCSGRQENLGGKGWTQWPIQGMPQHYPFRGHIVTRLYAFVFFMLGQWRRSSIGGASHFDAECVGTKFGRSAAGDIWWQQLQ